mgnify:CR=1 FL=1
MSILIYIFNQNQKIIGANKEENDFLNNEIEYVLVNKIENIKKDVCIQNKKNYVEDYGIITKSSECRIQNRNRDFNDHTILENEYLVSLLQNISIEHLDIDTMIDDHMLEHNEETCTIN